MSENLEKRYKWAWHLHFLTLKSENFTSALGKDLEEGKHKGIELAISTYWLTAFKPISHTLISMRGVFNMSSPSTWLDYLTTHKMISS